MDLLGHRMSIRSLIHIVSSGGLASQVSRFSTPTLESEAPQVLTSSACTTSPYQGQRKGAVSAAPSYTSSQ
jgi:hypothetical protein